MFSNAYDHGVVAALGELEKVAGEKFAGKVGDAISKAKNAASGAAKSVYSSEHIGNQRYLRDMGKRKGVGATNHDRPDVMPNRASYDEGAKKSRNIRSGIAGGTVLAGGGGGTAYALRGDKKGRTKKAGIRESLSNMGGHIGDGASSAWGGIKRGAGAVQDFYSPEAIAAGRRPGMEETLRSNLDASMPAGLGKFFRPGAHAQELESNVSHGMEHLEPGLMAEAKRKALIRGLLTGAGLGAAGGGAAYGMSDDE